jgi:hypothetical protein
MRITQIDRTRRGDVRGVWFEVSGGPRPGRWLIEFSPATDEWWWRSGSATDADAPAWRVLRWRPDESSTAEEWRLHAHAHVAAEEIVSSLGALVGDGLAEDVVRRLRGHVDVGEKIRYVE